jgi:hypothetical protein
MLVQFGVSMCFPCVYNAKSLPNLGKLLLFSSLHLLEIQGDPVPFTQRRLDDSSACAGCETRVRPLPSVPSAPYHVCGIAESRVGRGLRRDVAEGPGFRWFRDHWTIGPSNFSQKWKKCDVKMWCQMQLIDLIDAKWCCFHFPPNNYIPEHVCSF